MGFREKKMFVVTLSASKPLQLGYRSQHATGAKQSNGVSSSKWRVLSLVSRLRHSCRSHHPQPPAPDPLDTLLREFSPARCSMEMNSSSASAQFSIGESFITSTLKGNVSLRNRTQFRMSHSALQQMMRRAALCFPLPPLR